MPYVTIPSAEMARLKAETIIECARWLDAHGGKVGAAKLRAYAKPYEEDAERGPAALTQGGVFRA